MTEKNVEQMPSNTAQFTALWRAVANRDKQTATIESDFMAAYFLPSLLQFAIRFNIVRARAKRKSQKLVPGMNDTIIARTTCFDKLFKEAVNEGIPQIVLLVAGYDSRAYRFGALNSTVKIVELDIAATQNKKRKYLQRAKVAIPGNVTLMPINFNRESLLEVLNKAGYDHGRRTLFLWEGVSFYLEPEAVKRTLAFVRSAHRASIVVFDYIILVPEEKRGEYHGYKELALMMQKRHANEKIRFAVGEGELDAYLSDNGLKLVSHLDNKEIEQAFLVPGDGSLTGQIPALFRFAAVSPGR
jgi:methyltransferase (TIGR00027 family)